MRRRTRGQKSSAGAELRDTNTTQCKLYIHSHTINFTLQLQQDYKWELLRSKQEKPQTNRESLRNRSPTSWQLRRTCSSRSAKRPSQHNAPQEELQTPKTDFIFLKNQNLKLLRTNIDIYLKTRLKLKTKHKPETDCLSERLQRSNITLPGIKPLPASSKLLKTHRNRTLTHQNHATGTRKHLELCRTETKTFRAAKDLENKQNLYQE